MANGYGESEAQNAGMYKTDFGYSFYPPHEEEDTGDDMATATKATHTPGPWKHSAGSRFITATYNGIDTPIAELCVLPRKEKFAGYDGVETLTELTEAEEQLNADLLASAPSMHYALKIIEGIALDEHAEERSREDFSRQLSQILIVAQAALLEEK